MTLDQLGHASHLVVDAQFDQSDNWAVRQSANEHQLTEVFVLGYEYTLLLERDGHEPLVARLGIDGDGRQHIVPLTGEEGLQGTR